MSKKHFIALADVMRELKPTVLQNGSVYADGQQDGMMLQWQLTVERVADFCRSQNYDFKRERWMDYINGECGPNGGARKSNGLPGAASHGSGSAV